MRLTQSVTEILNGYLFCGYYDVHSSCLSLATFLSGYKSDLGCSLRGSVT